MLNGMLHCTTLVKLKNAQKHISDANIIMLLFLYYYYFYLYIEREIDR